MRQSSPKQPRERVIDMSVEDQKKWEQEEMAKPIDLKAASVNIDPAPFQLVEKTSILKVHSLFSMVGINHAYVTKIGRLVGVVALKEVCTVARCVCALPLSTGAIFPFTAAQSHRGRQQRQHAGAERHRYR